MFGVWPAFNAKVGEDCLRLERRWDVTNVHSASSVSVLSHCALNREDKSQLAAMALPDPKTSLLSAIAVNAAKQ